MKTLADYNVKFYIPSYGRTEMSKQTTIVRLARCPETRYMWKVFIRPSEIEWWQEFIADKLGLTAMQHIVVLPTEVQGMSSTMRFVHHFAADTELERMICLDDDLSFRQKVLRNQNPMLPAQGLRRATDVELCQAFTWMCTALDDTAVGSAHLMSVTGQESYYDADNCEVITDMVSGTNIATCPSRTASFTYIGEFWEDVVTHGDVAHCLQQASKGYHNVINTVTIAQDRGNMDEGGSTAAQGGSARRRDNISRATRALQRQFEDAVVPFLCGEGTAEEVLHARYFLWKLVHRFNDNDHVTLTQELWAAYGVKFAREHAYVMLLNKFNGDNGAFRKIRR